MSEYSEENLDFWLAIEDFKKSKEKELKPKAEYIFKNFIAPNSKNQVFIYVNASKFLISC